MTDVIKALESKGYIVKQSENRWLGKLDENCPVVYEILNPDYSAVYGANGLSFERLEAWAKDLIGLAEGEEQAAIASEEIKHSTYNKNDVAARKIKEREFDNLYNEGAEGYNPYRTRITDN